METPLAFGDTWFWIVTVLFTLWAIACVESSKSQGASFVVVLYLALLHYYGNLNPFPWILQNPVAALGLGALYIVGGTLWAIVKWRFYVYSKARQIEDLRLAIGKQKAWVADSFNTLGAQERDEVLQAAGLKRIPPSVLDEKSRILPWMIWWPLSAAWTIVNDPIRRIFQQIYLNIAQHLQKVSDRAFKNLT